jgi:hypothetical protein
MKLLPRNLALVASALAITSVMGTDRCIAHAAPRPVPTRATTVAAQAQPSKLDPGLEAIARAWRRLGIKGAEQESAARSIPMDDLRLAAVIHLASVDRRSEVERALRRAWGEVVTVEGAALYVRLPVPAIRRISRMQAVESVRLDSQYAPAIEPSKETL